MDKRDQAIYEKELKVLDKLGYRTLSKLGFGTYGVVLLVEKQGVQGVVKIAINKISKEANLSEMREAIFLKQFDSPFIIKANKVYTSLDDSYIIIEIEKMDRSFNQVEKTKQTQEYYRKLIYSVVQALYHIHTRGFVHNDIKPHNILIKNDTFKLADFGLCNYMGLPIPNGLNTFCSTDYYKAPNSVTDSIYIQNNRYNYNSDIYSVGALMYWIVLEIPKIPKKKGINPPVIDITLAEYLLVRDQFIAYYGEEGVDFMERCLDLNTSTRMTSIAALEHPYLKNYKAAGGFGNFLKEKYPEEDPYSKDYIEEFYKNYKDVKIKFNKIKDTAGFIKEIDIMLKFTLLYNKSLESFIQYILLFRKVIHDFPSKKIADLSFCCFSIMNKVYELTACNVMLKRLLRDILHKTPQDVLIKLEIEILNYYEFNVPLVPIHSIIYYYFLKDKKIDINVSCQTAIRLLLSTRVDEECTLDELVKFSINPNKSNKLEALKKDGMINNIEDLDAIDEAMDDKKEEEENDEVELEICEIDGKKYLKDEEGTIYNQNTLDPVGQYNFKNNTWIQKAHNNSSKSARKDEVEVKECVIDGISYYKNEEGTIYDTETEEIIGQFDFSKNIWIDYKESVNSVYKNAMKLYEKRDHINMVRYLQHHMDLFSDKKYLNLRRVILEKVQDL
jgi:serine/threonine protein kinase